MKKVFVLAVVVAMTATLATPASAQTFKACGKKCKDVCRTEVHRIQQNTGKYNPKDPGLARAVQQCIAAANEIRRLKAGS